LRSIAGQTTISRLASRRARSSLQICPASIVSPKPTSSPIKIPLLGESRKFRTGLRYNGFWLYGEEPNDHEYLPIPAEPFVRGRLREGGGVYSSGEYWRELPQGLAGLVTVSRRKTGA